MAQGTGTQGQFTKLLKEVGNAPQQLKCQALITNVVGEIRRANAQSNGRQEVDAILNQLTAIQPELDQAMQQ